MTETPAPTTPSPDAPDGDAPVATEASQPTAPPEESVAASPVAELSPEPAGPPEPLEGGGFSADRTDQPPAGPSLSFGFNLGKIEGQGEDSDPILRSGRELGLVGVFDGMGGAGGTVYETPDGPRTGAYLASRIARDVVEERMLNLLDPDWHLDGAAVAAQLRTAVHEALGEHLRELKAAPSGLRSKLLRALPTTMALVALQRLQPGEDRWAAHLFWAGDSRVYVLTAAEGLQQLTVDDIRDRGDAMANLREDSVVSNAMSADTEFVVNYRQVELTAPFLAIAATDGCFGYVPSPMHVEKLLLSPLQQVQSTEEWSAALQTAITAVTGDDAAMSVLGIGADFRGWQRLLEARTSELERRWTAPLDEADERVRQLEQELEQARAQHEALQAELWLAYKAGYDRYLVPSAPKEET